MTAPRRPLAGGVVAMQNEGEAFLQGPVHLRLMLIALGCACLAGATWSIAGILNGTNPWFKASFILTSLGLAFAYGLLRATFPPGKT